MTIDEHTQQIAKLITTARLPIGTEVRFHHASRNEILRFKGMDACTVMAPDGTLAYSITIKLDGYPYDPAEDDD